MYIDLVFNRIPLITVYYIYCDNYTDVRTIVETKNVFNFNIFKTFVPKIIYTEKRFWPHNIHCNSRWVR